MEIDTTLPSVVAVRAHIPDDAFTAAGLGTLREGSGVVIGDKGLVLTIGYLITEAEERVRSSLERHSSAPVPAGDDSVLPAETLALHATVRRHYGLAVEAYAPAPGAAVATRTGVALEDVDHGMASAEDDPAGGDSGPR